MVSMRKLRSQVRGEDSSGNEECMDLLRSGSERIAGIRYLIGCIVLPKTFPMARSDLQSWG